MKTIVFFCITLFFISCYAQSSQNGQKENTTDIQASHRIINPEGKIIADRIKTPINYTRTAVDTHSFAYYLRHLPLKPHNTKVQYYNGKTKHAENVYMAVADIDVGTRDLQQCADAIMRLRAEYLYDQKQYDSIHFNFTNGFQVDYSKWREGYRVTVQGNKTHWRKTDIPSIGYASFRKYMDIIFMYAGTLSLEKELQPVQWQDVQVGDIFIQGGSPGHAVIVVDMCVHEKSGEKLFLLAQSYMPAQDIQILQNPNNSALSPWYSTNFEGALVTPEWTFEKKDLGRF